MSENVDVKLEKCAFFRFIICLSQDPGSDEILFIEIITGGITMEILKVSAKSNPNSVAGALAGVLREKGGAEIQAIGAGALNQAIKATAIARGFVAPSGIDLVCIPAFTDIQIEGEERTAIKLIVEPR